MDDKKNEKANYENNFNILEDITEQLNRDEISVDDLVSKTKEALKSAKLCLDILNEQRGEFTKLEKEFATLLSSEEKNNS
jgi:exodeoxyribonuclease VII small subunit